MEHLFFLINPISGGRSKDGFQNSIDQNLDKSLFTYEFRYTEYAGQATEILEERKKLKETIIAVGGDGTINEIAQILVGNNKRMGIIPQGSGNGLARHLGISLQSHKAIKQLNTAINSYIDTATLNKQFFISIAGVGFDSLVAQKFELSKNRGFLGYAKLVLKEYFQFKEQEYILNLDGKDFTKKAALISFANSSQFGYNAVIAPKAHIADGFLDVCIMRKPKLYQIPITLLKVWMGKANQSTLLEIIKAKYIVLYPNQFQFANIDGESKKVGEKVEIQIKPKSLLLKLPQNV